jgi:hypothetical protein
MEVVLDRGTVTPETWIWAFVREAGRIELGGQVVPNEQPTELVVVWRAAVECDRLRNIVGRTREVLGSHSESFRGRLTGYGPTKEFLNLGRFMAGENMPTFDAYRAELETPEDSVVIWANIAQGDDRSLADAADNIGMCVPLRSFTDWGGDLIAYAVSSTRAVTSSEARTWLDAIMIELLNRPEKSADA